VTVIGVVADARINGLKNTAQWSTCLTGPTPWTISFMVRSTRPGDTLIPEMQRAIWSIDPQVAIPSVKTMDEQVSDSWLPTLSSDCVDVLRGRGAAAGAAGGLRSAGVFCVACDGRSLGFGLHWVVEGSAD